MVMDYDARRKLFASYEGQKVVITVARIDYLRQGREVSEIPYTTTHVGRIKGKVFYEQGKRAPFSFMTGELVSIKRRT